MDTLSSDKIEEERGRLHDTDSYMILEYIRSSIEILMNLKIEDHEQEVEEKVKSRVKNIVASEDLQWAEAPKDYEKIIQKLEVFFPACHLLKLPLLRPTLG